MKKLFAIGFLMLASGMVYAQNDETKSDESSKSVQSTKIGSEKDARSVRTMKIQADDKGDEEKRKAFIDELRSLYKINFL